MFPETERDRERLLLEDAAMRARFPHFMLQTTPNGELEWLGSVEPIPGREFLITIAYPPWYPNEEPIIRVQYPALDPRTPHVYSRATGHICVHKQGDWNPDRHTAASCVPMVAVWLFTYMLWRDYGEPF